MDAEQLRERQAPLKSKYKVDPTSALRTLRAKGRVAQDSITVAIESGKPGIPAGLHPATGGDGSTACSADMLLEALVACAGVTLASVATAMNIELVCATVTAEGDIDLRGTLGVAKNAPVGFTRIQLTFGIDTDAPTDKVKKMIELTERYCVVAQTLANAASIDIAIE